MNKHHVQDPMLLVSVLEATNTGIVITDNLLPDNPIIYCNPAFEQMSGYSREEIIGRNCRFLQSPGPKSEGSFSDQSSDRSRR